MKVHFAISEKKLKCGKVNTGLIPVTNDRKKSTCLQCLGISTQHAVKPKFTRVRSPNGGYTIRKNIRNSGKCWKCGAKLKLGDDCLICDVLKNIKENN